MVKTSEPGPVKGPAGSALPVPSHPKVVGLNDGINRNTKPGLERGGSAAFRDEPKAHVITSRPSLNSMPYTGKKKDSY